MKNTRFKIHLARAVRSAPAALLGLSVAGVSLASGQVSSIQTMLVPATPFTYSIDGVEYQWGMGSNQLMEGFSTSDGHAFSYALSADRVEIRRDDIAGVTTGLPCGIFVERMSQGQTSRVFSADYPSDGSGTGNCDYSAMLASRVLNRGAVDLFSNTLPDAKNVERLDYLFDYGVLAPFSEQAMRLAGHVASEKASNNPVKIAAILQLDVLGQPAQYGPLMTVQANGCADPELCYGVTDVVHTYSFLQNNYNEPQSFPRETEQSMEIVGMAFVSAEDLGLAPGQRYYGFSFFADDVDASAHNLLDPSTFPDDTASENVVTGDDADIYGGLSGYFVADAINVVSGAVFNDINGDGMPQDEEAGISDIGITVYVDTNANGVLDIGVDTLLGDAIDTDMSGRFVIPGLPDGNYLVVMDESDPELPAGLVVAPGANPHPLVVAGTDPDPVYFPFVNADGSTGGGDDGGSGTAGTDGGADGATDGGADSGTDDGGADGATDGGADSGTDDGGADGATDGGADSGTDDGGADGATDGGADSGTDDGGADGATDGGADSGTDDGGADGGTDSGTDGGSTDGLVDDAPTRAVDDAFEVNQGSSKTLDVLANDIDGPGDGLTLVSVSSSPNASITIVDNQIVYRPNFGFYGQDSFLYQMEDSDGTRLSGNVSVEVVRYSDLNNNMVNDFVECNCTNLTLETGVHGSGVGQLSFWAAGVLAAGVWFRRRSQKIKPTFVEHSEGDLR